MCIRETKLRMKLNMKFHISHKLCIINLYRWNFLNIKKSSLNTLLSRYFGQAHILFDIFSIRVL